MKRLVIAGISALALLTSVAALGVALVAAQIIGPEIERPEQFPRLISYHGSLTDSSGAAVNDEAHTVTFNLYTEENARTAEWTETHKISTVNGSFDVLLGSIRRFPATLFKDNLELYLGVQFDREREMSPRQRLTAVPYALNSLNADMLDGLSGVAFARRDHVHGSAGEPACGFEWRVKRATPDFEVGEPCLVISNPDPDTGVGSLSMKLGIDGLPVIAYRSNSELKVARCADAECSSASVAVLEGNLGPLGSNWYAAGVGISGTIGTDGNMVIGFFDTAGQDLKVAHCENADCTSSTITTLDSENDVGRYPSIAIGNDGFPVIAYYDSSENRGRLKVAHCQNVACTSSSNTRVIGQFVGTQNTAQIQGGEWPAIAVPDDGLPVILYRYGFNDRVRYAKCKDIACNSADINDVDIETGRPIALTIDEDGTHYIARQKDQGLSFRTVVSECADIESCEDSPQLGQGPRLLFTFPESGTHLSIALGPDGAPVTITSTEGQNADLHGMWALRCLDTSCENKRVSRLASEDVTGKYNSAAILPDGRLVVAYGAPFLQVLTCSEC